VGGCLCDNPEVERALKQEAFAIARSIGASSVEIREFGDPEQTVSASPETMAGKKFRMMLDLPGSREELWDGFKSKLRSQIRKAEKNGLGFTIDRDSTHLEGFYRVFANNMHKLGSPVHPRRLFESISDHYAENMFISLVKLQRQVVGAGLVLLANGVATIPWASTLAEYNRLAPNMLLYWSVLKKAVECGSFRFDFGRSTFDEGTYRFKQQWGCRPVSLDWQIYDAAGEKLQVNASQGSLRKYAEKAWPRMPLPVANILGPLIRKHISL
jgi:FemAB-related protein (PEP-CTERM system-associated)